MFSLDFLCPTNNCPDRVGAASILFRKNASRNTVRMGFDDDRPFLRAQRFAAKRGRLFHEVYALMDEIIQEENCFSLKDLAVNGHDMMTLGFQGPSIGLMLQECLDAVLDERIPNEYSALISYVKAQHEER